MENSDWSALIWGGAITVAVFVAATVVGIALAGIILVKMPANYFCDNYCRDFWADRHPFLRWSGRVFKNLLGASLVVLGGVLSLPGVPGPGLLTILLGITLLDFPGKQRMERWLIGRPVVLNAINRLRRRYGKSPVTLEFRDHMDRTRPSQRTTKETPHAPVRSV
jgi:UPF0716 family protein affecting phage T7 exclusion